MKITNINVNILKDILKEKPEKEIEIKTQFPEYNTWLEKKDYPTYDQLSKLSKIFNIPFGYFFLKKLPKKECIFKDFKLSYELSSNILFIQNIQELTNNILLTWKQDKLSFCEKYKNNYNTKEIMKELKTIFEIDNNFKKNNNSIEIFNYLINKTEEKGILVFNLSKFLDKNSKGFVLYDQIAPFIIINNLDNIFNKSFTLINSLIHILIGQNMFFDLQNLKLTEIEQFCNNCTIRFLTLIHLYKKEFNFDNYNIPDYISKRFLNILDDAVNYGFLDTLNDAIIDNVIQYKDKLIIINQLKSFCSNLNIDNIIYENDMKF